MTGASVEPNRRAQAEMYGEPLGDLIGRCATTLGLTQGRVASLLGISAPMLSQLINAHRVKIGNPAAVHRLQAMYTLAQRVGAGELNPADAIRELEEHHDTEGVVTSTTSASTPDPSGVRALFRAAGSPDDFARAAEMLQASHPAIATLLLTYGGTRRG